MVQEVNLQSIPEELYNLTQLADVTLAAEKLSTTNHQEIKEFIRTEEQLKKYALNSIHDNDNNGCTCSLSDNEDEMSTMDSDVNTLETRSNDVDNNYMKAYSINTPTIPERYSGMVKLDPTKNDEKIHSVIKSVSLNTMSLKEKPIIGICFDEPSGHDKPTSSPPQSSSSDEDLKFNSYAHKIFDKRKSRKLSLQSDDSGYNVNHCLRNSKHKNSIYEDINISTSETESNDFSEIFDKQNADGSISEDIHICPDCGKKYSTSSNLARHRQTHR